MALLLLYFVSPTCHSYQRCPRKDLFCTLKKVTDTEMPGNTMKYGVCYHPILRTDLIFLLNGTEFIVWRRELKPELEIHAQVHVSCLLVF